MADHVLSLLRVVMHWHAKRGDDFRSPIVRGMNRTKVKERARKRILTDDELRTIWKAATGSFPGPYDYLVCFLLLTATRLREASKMTRGELSADGTEWTIPAGRHKSKCDFLAPLSKVAQEMLAKLPVIGTKGLVFTNDGVTSLSGFRPTGVLMRRCWGAAQGRPEGETAATVDEPRSSQNRPVSHVASRRSPVMPRWS
jgi:integrase